MNVRTFEATRMKDAIAAVKRELGQDAVILSTKEYPQKGPGGSKLYEVVAAAAVQSRQGGSLSKSMGGSDPGQKAQLDYIEKMLTDLADKAATQQKISLLESGIRELKMILLEAVRDDKQSFVHSISDSMLDTYTTLNVMGLDASILADLMLHLKSLPDAAGMGKDLDESKVYYKSEAIRWMMKRIKITPNLAICPGCPSIHALVGPSGVGKTTMTAKLASHYHLKEKVSTLVVSFDNQKVGGSELLRIYTKIIGVPYAQISEPSQIKKVVQDNKNPDLVLVDTSSRNPRSVNKPLDLNILKNNPYTVDLHLTLSTTDKADHLDNSVRYFSSVGIQSLMFTKLDESWSYGDIYNLSQKWTLPLSFFSTGEGVPDDLERASRERVVERIFGI